MTTSSACVDSSFLLKLFVREEGSERAEAQWQQWADDAAEVLAPTLLLYEITSALRKKVFQGKITAEYALVSVDALLELDLLLVASRHLHRRALELATALDRPNTYDSYYLAVAHEFGCPLWTSDRRLYNAVRGRIGEIRYVGAD